MQLNYPSITKYYDYNLNGFGKDRRMTILSEYCSHGSLKELLEMQSSILDNTKKLIIIYGIASAMQYLHFHNICHYGLKTESIFIDDNFHPKINDIGFSIYFLGLEEMAKIKSISYFMAPEKFISDECSKSSEVYSFVMIVLEILAINNPLKHLSQFELLGSIIDNKRPYLNETIPNEFRCMIEKCTSRNPDERLTFEEICKELRNNVEYTKNLERKSEYYSYIKFIDDFIDKNKSFNQDIKIDECSKIKKRCLLINTPKINKTKKKEKR